LTVGLKMNLKRMHKGILTGVATVLIACLCLPVSSGAARIKDISSIGGIRDNQLVGYGLVVGLMSTGDSIKNGYTRETLSNMLSRQGLAMRDKDLKSNNIAAVMITAVLPPFAKTGAKLDVMVSSVGDAKSLLGGTLLMTPLRGADNEIYAVAQGAVVVGGFVAGANSASGSATGKNHTTVGYITNGALIEKELRYDFEKTRQLTLNLYQPDFTTLTRLASTVNSRIGDVDVKLVDSSSALITVKNSYKGSIVSLLSAIENLDVSVDTAAVVVLNEKTGTVVMGENVRISTIAVAHGNLSFQIREDFNVSQPLPYAPRGTGGVVDAGRGVTMGSGGQTVVTPSTQINVSEEKRALTVMPRGVTIQDVVRGLNAMGVTPRDLIQILQTIKAAGSLQADLKVM
jgi:flagellar P-ring protein precursor FlgI